VLAPSAGVPTTASAPARIATVNPWRPTTKRHGSTMAVIRRDLRL
jgi:hypothetical protein